MNNSTSIRATHNDAISTFFAVTTLAFACAILLTLTACQKSNDPTTPATSGETVGQKLDKAIDKTNEKMGAVGDKVGAQMEKAGDAVSAAATSLKAGANESAAKTGDAISDMAITASINADLLKDPELSVIKIDVDTKLGAVVLNGLTPNESARQRAEKIASAVKGVTRVSNNLTVKKM